MISNKVKHIVDVESTFNMSPINFYFVSGFVRKKTLKSMILQNLNSIWEVSEVIDTHNLISLVSLGECGLARAEGALFLVLDFPRPLDMGTALWLSELGLLGGESLSCDWVMLENAPCCGGVEFWDLLERFAELEEMEVLFNWLMIPLAPELLFFPRPPFSDLSTEWDLQNALKVLKLSRNQRRCTFWRRHLDSTAKPPVPCRLRWWRRLVSRRWSLTRPHSFRRWLWNLLGCCCLQSLPVVPCSKCFCRDYSRLFLGAK